MRNELSQNSTVTDKANKLETGWTEIKTELLR